VLIAGDGRRAWDAIGCGLGEVAIWALHGEQDEVVPAIGSIETMEELQACPAPPRKEARLTTYPGVGHNSWTRTYDGSAGHDIYAWLLGLRR
jgi:pimeloyl-ACP methyl ester carboxylesterase